MKYSINKILVLLCLLTAGFTNAAAEDYLYVITDNNGNFLANNSGTLSNSTSFNPKTCVWTCSGNGSGTLANQGKYLYASLSAFSSYSLSINSNSTEWTISGNKVYTGYLNSYYIQFSNNSWSTNKSTTNAASCYSATKVSTEAVKNLSVEGDKKQELKHVGDRRSYNAKMSYTPAYNTWTFNGTSYYSSTDDSYVSTNAPEAITNKANYKWSSSASSNVKMTTDDTDDSKATASYDSRITTQDESDQGEVSLMVTATIPASSSSFLTSDIIETASVTETLLTRSVATITANVDKSTISIDETAKITATASSGGTISYSSSNTDIATVSTDGTVTAVSTGGAETATVTITLTTPQTDDYEAASSTVDITVTRRPNPVAAAADKTELYVGETAKITVSQNTSGGTISYLSENEALATVGSDGTITAVSTGGVSSASVAIKVTSAQSGDYQVGTSYVIVSIKKRPTTLSLAYDKSTTTYGNQAPVLTQCKLTDATTGSEISGNVSFTSSSQCITLNNAMGELTVHKAGTAVITATFTGNDTYDAATAKFTITVNKAPTLLTFPQSDYVAQLSHTFTSPTATLMPAEAGNVTYSFTSDTDGLITINSTTGEVQTNTLTGTATVTATFAGNDCYEAATASYTLLVSTKAMPTLSASVKPLFYVDETNQATASTNSTNGCKFESTDTDVITVDADGTITAVGEGYAAVRVTSLEDDTYVEYYEDYPINVFRYPTQLTFSYPQTIYFTDHEGEISPSLSLIETATNTTVDFGSLMSFNTSDANVVTVDALTGHVTIKGSGIAVVTATYGGNRKYQSTSSTFIMMINYASKPGSFIYLKDASGNYLSADGTTVSTTATQDASALIWYGTDRSLLFYQCGRYLGSAAPTLAPVVAMGESGTSFTYTHTDDKTIISDGTQNLSMNGNDTWTVEQALSLPLTFKSVGHGYSTLYSPCALQCPAGVTAFYPTSRTADDTGAADYVITLQSLLAGVIPKNTPVVLYTSDIDTYQFTIIDSDTTTPNDQWSGLAGTMPAITTASAYQGTQFPYTLQPDKSGSAGFYPWQSNYHSTIEPFRCYIPGANAAQSKGFRFSINNDDVTGISTITTDTADDTIYNINGTALGTELNTLPAGIYIRNGKKILKR